MITLTFPDGTPRQFADRLTGRDVAEGIAKSLAKRTVAMALDGTRRRPRRPDRRATPRSSSSTATTRARSS